MTVAFDSNHDPHLTSEQLKAIDKIVSQLQPFESTQAYGYDVKELLFNIDDKCRRRGVLELRSFVLADLLKGAALKWFSRLEVNSKYDWGSLSKNFLNFFVGDNYKASLKKDLKRKQSASESISDFNLHFEECVSELEDLEYKLPEEDLVQLYRSAIHTEILEKMEARFDKPIKEVMNEARKVAIYLHSIDAIPEQKSLNAIKTEVSLKDEVLALVNGLDKKFSKKMEELSKVPDKSHHFPKYREYGKLSFSEPFSKQCSFCKQRGNKGQHLPDRCYANPVSPSYRPPRSKRSKFP